MVLETKAEKYGLTEGFDKLWKTLFSVSIKNT